jgi:DNA adenine methylase
LICYSFNNSIRFNSKNEFNIAFGKDRSDFNLALQERLKIFIQKLKYIKIYNKSFEDIKLDKLKPDDYLYCDPPYLITVANYNENGGWNDVLEVKLLEKLNKANEMGVRFGLSNVLEHKGKSNDILKEWASNYNIHYLNHNYSNCNYRTKDKSKNSSIEVLITNY